VTRSGQEIQHRNFFASTILLLKLCGFYKWYRCIDDTWLTASTEPNMAPQNLPTPQCVQLEGLFWREIDIWSRSHAARAANHFFNESIKPPRKLFIKRAVCIGVGSPSSAFRENMSPTQRCYDTSPLPTFFMNLTSITCWIARMSFTSKIPVSILWKKDFSKGTIA
jgi:hypothetical protein